jgi:hypothetical protein
MIHRSLAGCLLIVGLLLTQVACKQEKEVKQKCSTQTKCTGGFKCEKENGGGPVTGPLDVGFCEKDICAITVACEKPQHSQHPQKPCLGDEVEVCDLHDPNHFCKCASTTNNEAKATTGNTPTTG